jgi:hypothetical protein
MLHINEIHISRNHAVSLVFYQPQCPVAIMPPSQVTGLGPTQMLIRRPLKGTAAITAELPDIAIAETSFTKMDNIKTHPVVRLSGECTCSSNIWLSILLKSEPRNSSLTIPKTNSFAPPKAFIRRLAKVVHGKFSQPTRPPVTRSTLPKVLHSTPMPLRESWLPPLNKPIVAFSEARNTNNNFDPLLDRPKANS